MKISPINRAYINNLKLQRKTAIAPKKINKIPYIVAGLAAVAVTGAAILAVRNKNLIKKLPIKTKQEEFIELCKSACEKNYQLTKENMQSGVFNMDLHSHSNHSDGWGQVQNILNEAAEYADKVHEKTGKKFTFALTDHDTVSGVSQALDIINSDPEKYKNLNFIPGVELSFSFNSNGEVKAGELLAYFIDPNSRGMKVLVEDLRKNRNLMLDDGIKKLGKGFLRSDMEDYFINHDGETFAYNLHWRLRNYAQIKNRINNIAIEQNVDPNMLYKKIMNGYVFQENGRVPKPFVSPDGLDAYLKKINMQTDTKMIDENINNICNEFFPKIVDGKIVSSTENSIEKIVENIDDDVILGFAHPYFTAVQMNDFESGFNDLLKSAKGKIIFSENFHQAYNANIPREKIEKINEYLLGKNLIPIGGRDNHGINLLPK